MQDLFERAGRLERKLREAERAKGEYERANQILAERMEWTPAKWNYQLDFANAAAIKESSERVKLERELAETKAALEDALHDAKRWRAIAENGLKK